MLVLHSCRGPQRSAPRGSVRATMGRSFPERASESLVMVCARDVLKTLAAAGCWAASGRFNLFERGCEDAPTALGCQAQNHKILRWGKRNTSLIVAAAKQTTKITKDSKRTSFQPFRSSEPVSSAPMAAPTQVVQGLWQISLGAVNAFLIDDDGELTLIDTGLPKSDDKIVAAIESTGKNITDLKHIILTHCHPDHSGSVAALKRRSGARVYMHPVDAVMVRKGETTRPMSPAPGLLRGLMYRMFIPKKPTPIEPCAIDQEIDDGTELPIAGGIKAIHIPGQCAGQVALLWPRRKVLFAADACANMPTFG